MIKANQDIRKKMNDAGLKQWQVADAIGVHEQTFLRRLRRELPETEKQELFKIIDEVRAREVVGGAGSY